MRLRNKKTGVIGELRYEPEKEIHFTVVTEDPADVEIHRTLAGLNAEWEDYKPAEPLIKDEKIRKAVRAWAEAEGIEEVAVLCHTVWEGKMTEIVKPDDASLEITFRHDLGIKMGNYIITELCGEEEE